MRGHPTLQNMNFYQFFLLLWVVFALLDPDPDSGSGSTDPIEYGSGSGSGSTTLEISSETPRESLKKSWLLVVEAATVRFLLTSSRRHRAGHPLGL
jgi:hypothetical protein